MQRSPDLASLCPDVPVTRRALLQGALASGFALAVRPVAAATISTPTAGLVAGEVSIPVRGGAHIPGYRAMPIRAPGSALRFPTVLVVQEIFGVHEHIRDVCRRFAQRGYCAIAPELFAREGNVATMTDIDAIL
jgi:carboxymethylenebutenolidase